MQSCIPIEDIMLCQVLFSPYMQFNFCNKNNSNFLCCLYPSSKIQKGVKVKHLLFIKLLKKLYLKSSLTNSLVANLDNLAPLDKYSWMLIC